MAVVPTKCKAMTLQEKLNIIEKVKANNMQLLGGPL
jgi:hypothetical protein